MNDSEKRREQQSTGEMGKNGLPSVADKKSIYYWVAKIFASTEPFVGCAGCIFGFFFFLMPLMSPSLMHKLQSAPFLNLIFDEITKLSPRVVMGIISVVLVAIITQELALSKGFPGGWDVRQRGGLPTAREVIRHQLYPVSITDKVIFFLWAILCSLGVFLWAFPFASLAYFMRIGGIK